MENEDKNLVIEAKNLVIEDKNLVIKESAFKNDVIEKMKIIIKEYVDKDFFGGKDIENSILCSKTTSYNLLKYLKELDLIEPVYGHGKGKYKFKK